MREPTLIEFDQIRKEGLRPGVIICLINEKQVLMVYQMSYGLWQVPQGGIRTGETVAGALRRILKEDLGQDLIETVGLGVKVIGSEQMLFPDDKVADKTLILETGEEVPMKGKFYYFVTLPVADRSVDMASSIYEIGRWVSYEEGKSLAGAIYQKGKQRVTEKLMELLKSEGFIA